MTEQEAETKLRDLADQAEALCGRLETVRDSLPVSPLEPLMLVGEEEMDTATERRLAIECILEDRLRPAVRQLRDAAAVQTAKGEP
ncbi:MAG TPA: hypothetical protein VF173_04205 [Thermoanaerobaculia bacterium]|nr:hypothetical protein [Thermoanaerobaculia bacterium]